jgi:hypothetical protein
MTYQEKVFSKYPTAYLYWRKSRVEIRRPRERTDPAALVGYVILSGVHWTDEEAWHDAANRVQILEKQ